jgi:lysophospholipase L1-like esterase
MAPIDLVGVLRGWLFALLALVGCTSDRGSVTAPPVGEEASTSAGVTPSTAAIRTVAMVGDSITVGATPALEQAFGSLGLDVVAIDAQEGRRIAESAGDLRSGIDAVGTVAASQVPDLWVIALGTNDIAHYDPAGYSSVVSQLLAALPDTSAPVVWVDVYNGAAVDATRELNTALNDVLRGRPDSVVAPWSAVAGEAGIVYDEVHPTEEGNQLFASTVAEAVTSLTG